MFGEVCRKLEVNTAYFTFLHNIGARKGAELSKHHFSSIPKAYRVHVHCFFQFLTQRWRDVYKFVGDDEFLF